MDTTLQGSSIDNSCRCCGSNVATDQVHSLFEYSNIAEMELIKIIQNVVPINIFKSDGKFSNQQHRDELKFMFKFFSGLSQVICEDCKNQALNAYKFQQMCISTDDCLRMNRKPFLNNEHDYSLYMNDDYDMRDDMDLSEYLMGENDTVDHETVVEDLPIEDTTPIIIDRIHEVKEKVQSHVLADLNLTIDQSQKLDSSAEQKKGPRYKCSICNKLWPTPSKLKRHLKVHETKSYFKVQQESTKDLNPEVQCPICFVALESQKILNEHMMIHKSDKKIKEDIPDKDLKDEFLCSVCGSDFKTARRLQNHINTQHIRKVSIIARSDQISPCPEKMKARNTQIDRACHICSKKFDCPSKLLRHLPIHKKIRLPPKRKPSPKRHQCQVCGKKFETPSKLKRHQVVHVKDLTVHHSIENLDVTKNQ